MSKVYNFGQQIASQSSLTLNSIEVINPPNKIYYLSGDSFDSAGMVIGANYSDGASGIVTGYTVSPSVLKASDTKVTISYSDNFGSSSIDLAISVSRIKISYPYQAGELVYNGEQQSPVFLNYDENKMNISGPTSATNAETYEAFFTPKEDYAWEDGSFDAKSVTWKINRAPVPLPENASSNFVYSGSTHSPVWNNYDSAKLSISGATSGINAGSYDAIFTPTSNYCWMDGTEDSKTVTWIIEKAPGSVSVSPTSLNITSDSPNSTVTVTKLGNGAVTATSSNTAIATASVSGNSVTVKGVGTGSCTITIKTSDNNYLEASATVAVTMKKYTNNTYTVLITKSGTWKNPFSTELPVKVLCFGGGGGAYSTLFGNYDEVKIYGGGGGGGHMASGSYTLSANESVFVTIGTAGTSGLQGTANTSNGGTTSFGTYLRANGGSGASNVSSAAGGGTGGGKFYGPGGDGTYGGGGGGGGAMYKMTNTDTASLSGNRGGKGGNGGTYGGGGGGGGGSGASGINSASGAGSLTAALGGVGGSSTEELGGAGGNGGAGGVYTTLPTYGMDGEDGTNTNTQSTLEFRGSGLHGNSGDGGTSSLVASSSGTTTIRASGGGGGGGGGGGFGGSGGKGGNGGNANHTYPTSIAMGGGYGGGGGGGGGYGAMGGVGNSYGNGGGGGGYGGRGLDAAATAPGGGGGYGIDNYGAGGRGSQDDPNYIAAKSGVVVITYTVKELT